MRTPSPRSLSCSRHYGPTGGFNEAFLCALAASGSVARVRLSACLTNNWISSVIKSPATQRETRPQAAHQRRRDGGARQRGRVSL